ncbi:hypothetical protein Hanom_Chr08g00739021 [Helianthus anomalus]
MGFAGLRKRIYEYEGKECHLFNGEVGRRKWHPPWRPIDSAPNAANQIEWRPPWSIFLSLRTRTLSTRWEYYVPTNSFHVPLVVKIYFSMQFIY